MCLFMPSLANGVYRMAPCLQRASFDWRRYDFRNGPRSCLPTARRARLIFLLIMSTHLPWDIVDSEYSASSYLHPTPVLAKGICHSAVAPLDELSKTANVSHGAKS